MNKDSLKLDHCAVCGYPRGYRSGEMLRLEQHHEPPKGIGGIGRKAEEPPTVTLCGFGNAAGCHGLRHSHYLHLRHDGRHWEWKITREPMKDYEVSEDNWHECR